MLRNKTNVRPSGLADSLRYVFLQMDAHQIGKKATGYEYVPSRRQMTTQERRTAREALRQALRDSVSML